MSALCSTLWILISFFFRLNSDHPHSIRTSETCLFERSSKISNFEQLLSSWVYAENRMIIIHLLWLLFDIGPGHGEGDRAVVLASIERKKQTSSLLLIFIDLIFTQSANCEIKYLLFFSICISIAVCVETFTRAQQQSVESEKRKTMKLINFQWKGSAKCFCN